MRAGAMTGRDRRTCPRCDRDNADEPAIALSRREWTLRRCRACGFVYLENPPLRSDLEDGVFAWETNFDERDERMRREHPVSRSLTRLWRRTVRRLVPRPDTLGALTKRWVPPGLVVDVGCGGGGWLVRLAERYDVVGVEISAALAREAEGRLAARGGRVVNLPAVEGLAGLGAATASGVVMRSFLEHEHEPMALLRQARRVLRPDGALVVKVPNFACWNRRIMGPR